MRMKNPPHPGGLLRAELEERGMTITSFAKAIRAARPTVQNICTGKAGISPEMAVKLEEALGMPAHIWVGMQSRHDLAKAEARRAEIVKGIKPLDDKAAA